MFSLMESHPMTLEEANFKTLICFLLYRSCQRIKSLFKNFLSPRNTILKDFIRFESAKMGNGELLLLMTFSLATLTGALSSHSEKGMNFGSCC
jgi:hypothetical protein